MCPRVVSHQESKRIIEISWPKTRYKNIDLLYVTNTVLYCQQRHHGEDWLECPPSFLQDQFSNSPKLEDKLLGEERFLAR